ncbi:MAG: DUF192 domain-containing protein [Candidatus Daviesbacteria bacterium]|nr:DUF192 domain-containing protein [Candidatus Daviesbacteria bacterium]
MKKFFMQIIVLVIFILGGLYLTMNQGIWQAYLPGGIINPPTNQIKIGETLLNVEIADTQGERSKGLSGRETLASSSGMLFIFPEPKKYQFWMKEMKFPLDMIFIKDGKVVDFLTSVPVAENGISDANLPRYQPTVPIDMLLEVNAGFIQSNNILKGETVFLIAK